MSLSGQAPTVLIRSSLCNACLRDAAESMSVRCTMIDKQVTSQPVYGKALKVLNGQICPRRFHVHAEDAAGIHRILLDA